MYGKPVLHDFAAQQDAATGNLKPLPAPPAMGDFDINQVLKSEYFFAEKTRVLNAELRPK